MGILKPLAFWKKIKGGSTPVKPFVAASAEAKDEEEEHARSDADEAPEPCAEAQSREQQDDAAGASASRPQPRLDAIDAAMHTGEPEVVILQEPLPPLREPASPSLASHGPIEDGMLSPVSIEEVEMATSDASTAPTAEQAEEERESVAAGAMAAEEESESPEQGSAATRHLPVPAGPAATLAPLGRFDATPATGAGHAPSGASTKQAQDEFTMEVPPKQVYATLSEAFGPLVAKSIQSSKWDQRTQALKSMGAVLKGLDLQAMSPPGSTGPLGLGLKLRDRARCWQCCCQVLHLVMKDKVIPVRLASHELFTDTFSNMKGLASKEHVQVALDALLPHLLDRLGDSNLRLHESARKCVLLCAEGESLLGLDGVLQRLRGHLDGKHKSGDRAKVLFGILDTVTFLVRHFPGHRPEKQLDDRDSVIVEEEDDEAYTPGSSWTQDDVVPFIIAGMHDNSGPRSRQSAVQLAVSVYATFGMEAMEPMLSGMRPAIQALLRQKFREYEEDDLEEMPLGPVLPSPGRGALKSTGNPQLDGLVVCGHAVAMQSPARQPQLPGTLPEEDEEVMMDTILEDTGMVFGGGHMIPLDNSKQLGGVPRGTMEHLQEMSVFDLSDEDRILEEELLGLGFDLETLGEEQEVLMNCRSPKPIPARPSRPMEVF